MEQKQIDEVEETFSGEEFIDEMDLLDSNEEADSEEIKIEPVSKPKKRRKAAKKEEPTKEMGWLDEDEDKDEDKDKDKLVEDIIIEPKTELNLENNEPKEEFKEEIKENINKKPGKNIPPVNPWEQEKKDDEDSMFKEVSTWKAITGIAIILLIFSVFSNGFNFTGAVVEDGISLTEAEIKAQEYVNANFLREPFLAEVTTSEEVGNLYKITLLVAGENVDSYITIDSYITKDGNLFFPQGFDTALSLEEQLLVDQPGASIETELEETQETIEEVIINPRTGETTVREVPRYEEEIIEEPIEEVVIEEPAAEVIIEEPIETAPPAEEVVLPSTKTFSLTAKKWLFSPHKLTVNRGDAVILTIKPQDLDFTFAIPGFGVSEEISGMTTVEFTANKVGSFDFSCSSCEDWRGMTGTLVVE